MKRLVIYFALCLILSMLLLPVVGTAASDVSTATYVGTVRIVSVDASTQSNAYTVFNTTTQNLINGGYALSDLTDTALQTDGDVDTAYMPAPGTGDMWAVYVPSIIAMGTRDYKLYTGGGTNMSGKIRYFPGTGGMTINDVATLELGNDFAVEQKGYWDTSAPTTAPKSSLFKSDAARVWVSAASTISAAIDPDAGTETLLPTGAGDYTNIASVSGAATHWEAAADDTDGTYVYTESTSEQKDAYALADSALPADTIITSVTVYFRHVRAVYTSHVRPYLRLGSTETAGTSILANATTYATTSEVLARPGGGSWTVADINSLQVAVGLINDNDGGTSQPRLAKAYVVVTYENWASAEAKVTATSISSGEHTVNVTADAATPAWATGNVIAFDGTENSNVNAGAVYNAEDKFWVSMWIKFNSTWQNGAAQNIYLWGKVIDGDNLIHLSFATDGKLYFSNRTGASWVLSMGTTRASWTGGTWYHILATFSDDGATQVTGKIYVNGVEDATATDAARNPLPNGGNFVFGQRRTSSGLSAGFLGQVMNVVAGTDDLSAEEITGLAAGVPPGDETDYWYCDEGTGSTLTSYGSLATAGTAGASAAWATSTYTTGQTGRLSDFYMTVDSTRYAGQLRGHSVPDNANNWSFLLNNVMPYVEYHKIWLAGVLTQHIIWENDSATFEDQSAGNHDVTPTFRTTTSDNDITASIVAFTPVDPAKATGVSLTESGTMIGAPTDPGNLYTELTFGNFIGASFLNEVIDDAGIPRAAIWFPLATIFLCFVGLLIGKFSVLAQLVFMGVLFFFLSGTVFAAWLGIIFLIDGLDIVLATKSYGW